MEKVDVVLSLLTIFVAILAPVLTSWINARVTIKAKKMDMISSGVQSSIENFTNNYIKLLDKEYPYESYWDFVSSGYMLLAQYKDRTIHQKILGIIANVKNNNRCPNAETDTLMEELLLLLAKVTGSM